MIVPIVLAIASRVTGTSLPASSRVTVAESVIEPLLSQVRVQRPL